MRRRQFLQTSAVAAASMMTLPSFLSSCASSGKGASGRTDSIGLQLYSLRDILPKDPKGVLKKVADFGYKEIETYGYSDGMIYGMPFADFGKYVKDLGMRVVSGHYGLEMAKSDSWEKVVTDAKSIGQEYIIMPYIQEPQRKSIDDYKQICAALNRAGEVCNKNGIRFGYHNHAFEFDKLDGQIPFDVMLTELDPKKVGMEMDIYWVVRAGQDPFKYFEKYPGRFEQWHVKDMDKTDKNKNADLGTGTIDYKPYFAKAKQLGMKHFYVEQETYPGASIDSIGNCIKYLKTIV